MIFQRTKSAERLDFSMKLDVYEKKKETDFIYIHERLCVAPVRTTFLKNGSIRSTRIEQLARVDGYINQEAFSSRKKTTIKSKWLQFTTEILLINRIQSSIKINIERATMFR